MQLFRRNPIFNVMYHCQIVLVLHCCAPQLNAHRSPHWTCLVYFFADLATVANIGSAILTCSASLIFLVNLEMQSAILFVINVNIITLHFSRSCWCLLFPTSDRPLVNIPQANCSQSRSQWRGSQLCSCDCSVHQTRHLEARSPPVSTPVGSLSGLCC